MTQKEIFEFIRSWAWGTLIGIEGDKPYAIEVSYGTDGKYIYCGSKPGGRMAKCLRGNHKVVFKICKSDRNAEDFKAVIIEGKAEPLTDYQRVLHALRMVARQVELDENVLDPIAERHCQNPESNFIRIPIRVFGGIYREGGKFTLDTQ
jgi:nitroimidazol reductase NimA-like FMN-containing flavoprotein (pyridoxamine 5'-phosphate oxidase superfamily)